MSIRKKERRIRSCVYRVLEATLPSLCHVNQYVLLLLLPIFVLILKIGLVHSEIFDLQVDL